ncbi:MAP7 domain-containing protein 1 [Triticum aestivum]|uniref:MAP7 domain-containing protein 1 n=1 Tax=Triticum aestivum TaxID=4565 RepID=UPI001D026EF8|nr:MAP7 domain-containing protein 1-like [Triticum aestivum]
MEPLSPSCFSKRSSSKDIAGDRAKPCKDDSSALSPILPTPSSAPAPPPPSKGIAGDQAEPCVAAPSPIPVMASSAPAPPPPPILPQDLMEVTMGDVDDQMVLTIDKQAEKWEAMEQEQHVWNAIDEERKRKEKRRHKTRKKSLEEKRKEKREEKRKKQEKKRKNQEELQEEEELQGKRKHARSMNCSEFVQGATTEELQRRDSPPMTHSQRATRSPLVRSPVASTWRSSLGLLARVAASKRGRSPSARIASSPLEERANSSARSPSILGSPSPVTTPFGGSKINHPHVRKTRRLTSAVWRDFKPMYFLVQVILPQICTFIKSGM